MVEMIIGRAGTGKTFACLQRAKEILETEPLKTEIIFLLPAYQTYRAEMELAALTGGAFNTRMNSFSRFARQILDEIGGGLTPRISEIGRRLLLRKILLRRDKAGDLKYFVRAAKQNGFAQVVSEEIKELKNYSIDAEKLNVAADNITDPELKDKLHDLELLTEDFNTILADKLTDDENLLARATEFMEQSPTIANAEIFIDGFIFFDPQQRNFLKKLFACAKNVHITLPMDTDLNNRENVLEVGIFNRSFETFKTLHGFAEDLKVEFNINRLNSPCRFKNAPLKILEQRLFDYKIKSFNESEGLKIVEAVNKRAEVEFVAREILKLVKSGIRLREMGILVRDESYFSLIKPILELHAIPYFIDLKRAASNHPLAELIRSSLEILHGWRRESVFRCLRTGFFAVTQEEIDILENYVIEFGIKGAVNWQKTWDYRRIKSLDAPNKSLSVTEIEYLERINAIKKTCVEPLMKFSERVRNADKDVLLMTTALFKFLEELNVYKRLTEWSQKEELRGNLALSREHLKIWDDIISLFEEIVDALSEEPINRTEFESIIVEGLESLEMSLIPPGLDEITAAQFEQNSLQNSRVVFVLGFDNENFPRKSGEKNLLNDADRLKLKESGLEISLGGKENSLAEKFLIYRGLTEAKELLYLSYSIADAEGKKISAASFFERAQRIFPKITVEHVGLDILQNLGSELDFVAGEKILSAETAKKLYAPNKKMRASVTRFENFNECPFKYFSKYGLKLNERVEYKIQVPDVGNILHAVMSRFGRDLKRENRLWSTISVVELNNRVEKILDELTPNVHNKILLSTKTLEHRRERIKKVAVESLNRLIELDKVSQFHAQIFEKKFLEDKKIGDVDINLEGFIDRIDLSDDGKYFLIIDYKTGKVSLSLKKIFSGLNLQLIIYLSAAKNIAEIGERDAGAMLYCLLKLSNKTGRDDEDVSIKADDDLKMQGMIRIDDEIKNAVDNTGNFVNLKKDSLVSSADLQVIINYAKKLLEITAEKILSGDIEVKPAKFPNDDDACKKCVYSALCNFNKEINATLTPINCKNSEVISEMKSFCDEN